MEKRHFKIYIYSTSNSFHKSLGIMFLSISLRLQQKNHNFPHICLEIDFFLLFARIRQIFKKGPSAKSSFNRLHTVQTPEFGLCQPHN